MRDLIDRQAAIDASCTCHGGVHCNHYPCKDVQAIMDLPSVTERPRGRWVQRMYDEPTTCSECGGVALALSLIDEFGDEVLSRYCPHCGAFMENNDVDNE